jgi:hypothetical protein
MSDPTNNAPPAERPGFPLFTVGAALVVMLAFLALTWWIVTSGENPLAQPQPAAEAKEEPQLDPAAKLAEVNRRNEAALRGVGAKMSRDEARAKLLAKLKGPTDALPFPTEPTKTGDKKEEKKDEGKKDEKRKGDEP